ncbi:MAG: DUF5718 family protein [Spirochaetia bacterium]|nr:DUF5718 family protein [Spirochaetia bacterium]
MNIELEKIPCFGVAGNFTGHLEQAGEASDFSKIETKEANAPKAMFPTYIPGGKDPTPEFLTVYPFDDKKILFPKDEEKLQIEPECALICSASWNNGKLVDLVPELFGASNDCSIRNPKIAEGKIIKISLKKNWGKSTKGLSSNLIAINSFKEKGILDSYRIASFLVRDSNVFDYGEDSQIKGYSYFYRKLIDWCIEKINTQNDTGPQENILSYLNSMSSLPEKIMISVGATRYTEFGETNFLKNGDHSVVVLYPESMSHQEIADLVKKNDFSRKDISVLCQKIMM